MIEIEDLTLLILLNELGKRDKMRDVLTFVCLFSLILYVPVNNFSVMSEGLPGLNQY